ncbi:MULTISPECIES: type II toxin-antitoxin system Phd/YefM family antitoxin [Hydrogenophaga]|uniref:Antitoxin n=2 Tax=Hydrogenophaga TaxID=47420 RepID=A0ABW2QKH3_9BURK
MEHLLASASVSISELKKNPSAVIEAAMGQPVAVLNHNKPAAYLVPVASFEAMMEHIDDQALAEIVKSRQDEASVAVRLDDL